MKTESKKPHKYQSGYYCKQNFLKFLIAHVGISMPDCIFTSVDVENHKEFRDGDNVQIIVTGLTGENATVNFGDDNKTYIFRDIVVSDKEKEPQEDNPFLDEEEMSIKYHYYLEMPSNIIESNADTVIGNKAEWHMTNQSTYRDIYAKSEIPKSPSLDALTSLFIIVFLAKFRINS